MSTKTILDATCGSRMLWFPESKHCDQAIFSDCRVLEQVLCDGRVLKIQPDELNDFRYLPYADGAFSLVVFDPPHLLRAGAKSWLRAKYGVLDEANWRVDIKAGLHECWRVLAEGGTLIFKWAETHIKLSELRELFPAPPLFGTTGHSPHTLFIVFHKSPPTNNP